MREQLAQQEPLELQEQLARREPRELQEQLAQQEPRALQAQLAQQEPLAPREPKEPRVLPAKTSTSAGSMRLKTHLLKERRPSQPQRHFRKSFLVVG